VSQYKLPVWGQSNITPKERAGIEAKFDREIQRRERAVFAADIDAVEIHLEPESSASRLRLSPPVRIVFSDTGKVTEMNSVPVFSDTTKMRCPSFSLPAGPVALGGSCLASNARSAAGKVYVCKECYAFTESNYLRVSNQVRFSVRLAWVKRWLAQGSTALAGQLIKAIGDIPNFRYFRIHDSGDFMGDPRYVAAWALVASEFQQVLFWAPTRDWVYLEDLEPENRAVAASHGIRSGIPGMSRAMKDVPRNLVIRPSALNVNDAPPRIAGLAAGLAVLDEEAAADNERCGMRSGAPYCLCAAFETGGSCETARCRTCWEHPSREVGFPEH